MYFNNDNHIPLNTDKEKEFDQDGPMEIYEGTEFDDAVKMDMAELSSLFMGVFHYCFLSNSFLLQYIIYA
jgi:hypothetical protein